MSAEHDSIIRDHAERVVRTQRSALENATTPYADLTTALRHVQHEYEDRFLVELIQNAFDQQRGVPGGRIEILLALDEGTHGVLYVANGGKVIEERDVEGLIRLGHSSKVIGESIGNKGVGFRSVYRVCERPEFYSRSAAGLSGGIFDGFCFSSATPSDLQTFAGDDQLLLSSLREDIHPSFLPVVLEEQPSAVRAYAEQGDISTVVRLPLRDSEASELAKEKLAALIADDAPIDLFLDGIGALVVLVQDGDDGEDDVYDLTRSTSQVEVSGSQRHEIVSLGPHRGRWFVATRTVPKEQMREAIAESLERDELDSKWDEWDRDGEVAVAVPIGASEPIDGRLYTYLPMGEDAASPLAAHVTGPFMARLARRELDKDVALNRMLLDEVAKAAAEVAARLADQPDLLGRDELVDLISFDDPEQFVEAVRGIERDPEDLPLVPVVGERSRAPFSSAHLFMPPRGARLFEPARLASTLDLNLVDPAVGKARQEALGSLSSELGYELSATLTDQGEWFERVAQQLLEKTIDATWQRYYAELILLFEDSQSPDALRGRRLLLGSDQNLHSIRRGARVDSGERAVFSPARRAGEDEDDSNTSDLTPPPGLDQFVVLERLPDDQDLSFDDLLDWLEGNQLVRRFDRTELLRYAAAEARGSESEELRLAALQYVVRLMASAPGDLEGVAEIDVLVPCRGSFLPARHAAFGPEWGTSDASKLAGVLEARTEEEEFQMLAANLLVSPHQLKIDAERLPDWRGALQSLGVAQGLPLIAAGFAREHRGDKFPGLTRSSALPEGAGDAWATDIEDEEDTYLGARTRYSFEHDVPVMFGLEASQRLPDRERHRFAELLLTGLSKWDDHALRVRIRKVGGSYVGSWPTPLAAALRHFDWLPAAVPGTSRTVFVAPSQVWIRADEESEDPPDVLPLLEPRLRGYVGLEPNLRDRLETLGASIWGRADYAARMADALVTDEVVAKASGARRRGALLRAFRTSLEVLAEVPRDEEEDPAEIDRLLVAVEDRVLTVSNKDARMVAAPLASSTAKLLSDAGISVVPAPRSVRPVCDFLREAGWTQVRGHDEVRLAVTVDGGSLREAAGERLSERWPWLPAALGSLAGTGRVAFSPFPDPKDLALRCGGLLIAGFSELAMSLDGADLPMSESRIVPLREAGSVPILLVENELLHASDEELLPAIAEALCEVLNIPNFRADVQLALERLVRASPAPTSATVAAAFEVEPAQLDEFSDVDGYRRRTSDHLALVLGYRGFESAARELLDREEISSVELDRAAAVLDGEAEIVLTACESAEDPEGLWRELGLDLDRLNPTLATMSPPFSTIDRTPAFRSAIQIFLTEDRRAELRRSLRAAWFPTFLAGASLDGYVSARRLEIEPDPGWNDSHWDVPTAVVSEHIAEHGLPERPSSPEAQSVGQEGSDSVPGDLYDLARDYLQQRWGEVEVLIAAWLRGNGRDVADPIDFEDVLRAANDSGALDFVPLDDESAPRVLQYAGVWPEDMAMSTDPAAHAVSAEALDEAQVVLKRRTDRKARRTRVLEFADGTEIPVGKGGFAEVASYVEGALEDIEVPTDDAPLGDLPSRPAGPPRPGGRGGRNRQQGDREPSPAERMSVGLLGELVARNWLRRRYPGVYNDDCWLSSYRAAIGLPDANDDAGCDFELLLPDGPTRYEVKASRSNDPSFGLGSSEVQAADSAWRNGQAYYVLHVINVMDLKACRVRMLPNPRDPRNARKFRQGGGLQCMYQPNSAN